jgi:predicted AAA+ superfamily ATPase
MNKYYKRWQADTIHDALKTRRVLLLSGARQCGKTTLAKHMAAGPISYKTLDDPTLRELATIDPRGFIKHEHSLLVIDEIQRVPDLLSVIKLAVDEDTAPGQYLLTGSSNIQALPTTRESLAGRIRALRLRTLTQGELLEKQPTFLEKVFQKSLTTPENHAYDRKKILEIALRGGFPEAIKLNKKDGGQWHRDYIAALLERDLRDIANIQRIDAMKKLIIMLAAWSGKFMDISEVSAKLSIHRSTVESYIQALQALYIVESVSPWTRSDYARIGKQSKCYLSDSGLMASLLRWKIDQIQLDADRSGKLVETFMFNELAAQVDVQSGKYELFHYRDREQHEIDFLIERDDGALLGIEIKTGSTISSSDFKHLAWFKENIAKTNPFYGIVLYSGPHLGSMGDNLWAVPFDCLWNDSAE